jgi:hypothetical protein
MLTKLDTGAGKLIGVVMIESGTESLYSCRKSSVKLGEIAVPVWVIVMNRNGFVV